MMIDVSFHRIDLVDDLVSLKIAQVERFLIDWCDEYIYVCLVT